MSRSLSRSSIARGRGSADAVRNDGRGHRGAVALRTAIQHPELVERLVLVSTVLKRRGWYAEMTAAIDAMGPKVAEPMKQSPMYQDPPSHALESFELLGGGKRDAGWDRSGMTHHRLAILPGLTHYDINLSPALSEAVIPFLDSAS